MKTKAYRPKVAALGNLETFFAVTAFTEAGVFFTADEFLNSLRPVCKDGCDYNEDLGLCVLKA